VFIQYICVLDTFFESFSRKKEEALFSLSEFFNSPLILSIFSNWIEDNTILSRAENCELNFFDKCFINIKNVSLSILYCNKPFLTVLSFDSINILVSRSCS